MITGTAGLVLTFIGMIAVLGIVLWLFTRGMKQEGHCKVDHYADPYLPNLPKEVDDAVKKVLNSELPPDEILERYVMHRDRS